MGWKETNVNEQVGKDGGPIMLEIADQRLGHPMTNNFALKGARSLRHSLKSTASTRYSHWRALFGIGAALALRSWSQASIEVTCEQILHRALKSENTCDHNLAHGMIFALHAQPDKIGAGYAYFPYNARASLG
jgi:hypothetical protein